MSTQISKYFTLQEATSSDKAKELGIENNIPPTFYAAAVHTASCMDVVREALGTPIHVDSFCRNLQLNRALGSKDTSQHILCEAVDFISPTFGTPQQICQAIIDAGIDFDQLILEHGWVHISFKSNPNMSNRGHVLSLLANGTYAVGLTNLYGKELA